MMELEEEELGCTDDSDKRKNFDKREERMTTLSILYYFVKKESRKMKRKLWPTLIISIFLTYLN